VGFPWTRAKEVGTRGKESFFRRDETGRPIDYADTLQGQELKKAVEYRIAEAEQGRRVPSTWTPILKDDLLKKEKIAAGKVRVFTAGPVDHYLVMRQYFGAFCAAVADNRIVNECAVGFDSWSTEWTELAEYLLANSTLIGDSDIGEWDGHVPAEAIDMIVDVANAFYRDMPGSPDAMVRRTLLHEFPQLFIVIVNIIVKLNVGMPSGVLLTLVGNCYVNKIYMRLAWLSLTGLDLCDYYKHVRFVFCGDDMIVSISASVIDTFNMLTLRDWFAQHGITMTPAVKGAELKPYGSIHEAQFLKCAFRQDGILWRSLMDETTILELTQWVRTKNMAEVPAMTVANLNDSLRFCYHYGAEYFNWRRNQYREALKKVGIHAALHTYQYFDDAYRNHKSLKSYTDDFSYCV